MSLCLNISNIPERNDEQVTVGSGCRITTRERARLLSDVADTLWSVHLHTHDSPMSHENRKQQELNPVRFRTKRDQYDEEHPAVV